jgi:ferritin-like metal-binding protein YciE
VTSLQTLDDLLVDELRDIYHAERQLLKALPAMRKRVNNPRLSDALENHLRQTEGQVDRLEQIFQELDQPVRGKKCKGMEGLIEEGKEVLEADGDSDTLDAAIIGAAQRVEHYEIAAYGTAVAHARAMGHMNAVRLLEATLDEEKEADRLLTEIAEAGLNERATMPTGQESGESENGRSGDGNSGAVSRSGSSRGRRAGAVSRRGATRARTGRQARRRK